MILTYCLVFLHEGRYEYIIKQELCTVRVRLIEVIPEKSMTFHNLFQF